MILNQYNVDYDIDKIKAKFPKFNISEFTKIVKNILPHLLNEVEDIGNITDIQKYYFKNLIIAGGAPLRVLMGESILNSSSDIDIFSTSKDHAAFIRGGLCSFLDQKKKSTYAITYEGKSDDLYLKIQVIDRDTYDCEKVFSKFDFNICQSAFLIDCNPYTDEFKITLFTTPEFESDFETCQLNMTEYEINRYKYIEYVSDFERMITLKRMFKYKERGFYVDDKLILYVLRGDNEEIDKIPFQIKMKNMLEKERDLLEEEIRLLKSRKLNNSPPLFSISSSSTNNSANLMFETANVYNSNKNLYF